MSDETQHTVSLSATRIAVQIGGGQPHMLTICICTRVLLVIIVRVCFITSYFINYFFARPKPLLCVLCHL